MPSPSLSMNPVVTVDRITRIDARGSDLLLQPQDPLYDYIIGTPGDDHLVGTNDDDTIEGYAGHDGILGRGGDDDISGNEGDDYIRGDPGNDGCYGNEGNDYLRGGDGNDTMSGHAGFDRAAFFDSPVGVHVSLLLMGVAQDTGQGIDFLFEIEHLSGTRYNDRLIGDAGDNWLWGDVSAFDPPTGGGNDTLVGNEGDDLLDVATGNHRLIGGDGIDAVSVFGNSTDTLGGVTLDLNLQGAVQDTGQGLMFLKQIEQLSGSDHHDVLIGNHLANLLAGRHGDDTLKGGGGGDRLYGDGAIAIDAPHGTSGPIVELRQVDFPGAAAIGDDVLFGGNGADFLLGGFGADEQTGGGGRDIFAFQAIEDSLPAAPDFVHDFTMRDQVDVKTIDADMTALGNQDFHFVGAFTGAPAEALLKYDRTVDITSLYLDVDGDAEADAIIQFQGYVSTFYDFNGIA